MTPKKRMEKLADYLTEVHAEVTSGDQLYQGDADHVAKSLLTENGLTRAFGLPERIVHSITEYWRLEDEEAEKAQAEINRLRIKRDAEIAAIKDKYAQFGVIDEED